MRHLGYIRLWRDILDTSFYRSPNTCHLAIYLMLKANHSESKILMMGREILVKRGQLISGRNSLSKNTGLSPQEVRTCLNHLKSTSYLTIEATSAYSVITICKYEEFQGQADRKGKHSNQGVNQRPTKHQPSTNHKQ